MSEVVLDDAPWLTSGPAARVLGLLKRRWRGSPRGRRRRPQHFAEDFDRRYRHRDHRTSDEVVRRAKTAGIKCVPTGIEHGT